MARIGNATRDFEPTRLRRATFNDRYATARLGQLLLYVSNRGDSESKAPAVTKPPRKAMHEKGSNDLGVPLASSFYEFWDVLFPGELVASTALPKWIRGVIAGSDLSPHSFGPQIAPLSTALADKIVVAVSGLTAELTISGVGELLAQRLAADTRESHASAEVWPISRAPLFRLGLSPKFSPEWRQSNPFERFLEGARGDRWRDEAKALFEHAVHAVGTTIMSALRERLIDGQLVLFGVIGSDLIAKAQYIPADKIPDALFEMTSNRVRWSTPGLPLIVNVRIGRAAPKRRLSLKDLDDILIEKMRPMVESGEESAISAAELLVREAGGRGSDASKIDRVRRHYSAKYGPKTTR